MTERSSPYLLVYRKPSERQNTLLPVEPAKHLLSLGHMVIALDNPDFCNGYEQGNSQYK